jgi:hypothetical protein
MRRAHSHELDTLNELLGALRLIPVLTEKSRGVFHRGEGEFVAFCTDGIAMYGDVAVGAEWRRFRIESDEQRHAFLHIVTSLC